MIKESLSPEQLVEKGIQAFRRAIGDDKRIEIEISKDIHGKALTKINVRGKS